MLEVYDYIIMEERVPTQEELLELLDKAIQDNCVIRIKWNEGFHWRDMYITPEITREQVVNQAKKLVDLYEMGKHIYKKYFGV